MVPAYEPDQRLCEALASVLRQDLGPEEMQVAVIDDASTRSDVAALIARASPRARVELHRASQNRGLAANWNECIRLARGGIVHILHQDDRVDSGFYARLSPAFASHPDVGMAFCRHAYLDDATRVTGRSHRERWTPGVLANWAERISAGQRIQCASALVRRAVYERVGGYREDLAYALDWEMWVRIAWRFSVWYEPRTLAYYRRHEGNETARLRRENTITRDVFKAVGLFAQHLPPGQRERLLSPAYARLVLRTLRQLESGKITQGSVEAELELVRAAIEHMTHAPLRALHYRRRAARIGRATRAAPTRQ
jgi:glycosyltransferase involved in cell wall biosynthesis